LSTWDRQSHREEIGSRAKSIFSAGLERIDEKKVDLKPISLGKGKEEESSMIRKAFMDYPTYSGKAP